MNGGTMAIVHVNNNSRYVKGVLKLESELTKARQADPDQSLVHVVDSIEYVGNLQSSNPVLFKMTIRVYSLSAVVAIRMRVTANTKPIIQAILAIASNFRD
jgi:hypothetical protein